MKKGVKYLLASAIGIGLITGCSQGAAPENSLQPEEKVLAAETAQPEAIAPHKDLNQEPIPLKIERVGENEVNVEMTSQITDIEIDKGKFYKAWTFNGEAPGPVVVVNEGDTINFTLKTWIRQYLTAWTFTLYTQLLQKTSPTFSQMKQEHSVILQINQACLCIIAELHRFYHI